jgi:transcriptional regulator with XRE-family HTH domain
MFRENNTLGGLIRTFRRKNGWTLREMSAKVGIPLSTLAKVEADRLSLTYDKLQQFTARLGLSMTEFLGLGDGAADPRAKPVVIGRRSVTAGGDSVRVSTRNYDYEYLCADLRQKRMVPILVRVRAHSVDEFGEPVRHKGEEFLYVLEGTIEVHLQYYKPTVLSKGQGVYLDSTMEHAYIAKDCDSALVLAVCSSEDPDLEGELISLFGTDAKSV